eukprot:3644753-Rhodomonas_salina.2
MPVLARLCLTLSGSHPPALLPALSPSDGRGGVLSGRDARVADVMGQRCARGGLHRRQRSHCSGPSRSRLHLRCPPHPLSVSYTHLRAHETEADL